MKKFSLGFVLLLFCFSCQEDVVSPVQFKVHEITTQNFSLCQNKDCPVLELGILKAQGKTEVTKKINQLLEKQHIALFSGMENQSLPASLQEALTEFVENYRTIKQKYPDFHGGYELRISDELLYRTKEKVVLKTDYYLYTGGAHGYGGVQLNTFLLKTGALLPVDSMFSDKAAVKSLLEQKFRQQYHIPEGEAINATGFFFADDVFALPLNIAVLKDKVVFVYNPYEIASYAQGKLRLEIPKSELKEALNFE